MDMDVPESLRWLFNNPEVTFTADEVYDSSKSPSLHMSTWNCAIGYNHPDVDEFYVKWTGPILRPPTMLAVIKSLCVDFRALDSPEDMDGKTALLIVKEQKRFSEFIQQCVIAQMCAFHDDE